MMMTPVDVECPVCLETLVIPATLATVTKPVPVEQDGMFPKIRRTTTLALSLDIDGVYEHFVGHEQLMA